jgi:prepilin-type processing-associated H-X9-DG protein
LSNNLKQIGLATQSYHDVNGRLPPMCSYRPRRYGPILYHLLPYVEQAILYDLTPQGIDKDDPRTPPIYRQPMKVYHCPSEGSAPGGVYPLMGKRNGGLPGWGTSNYAANFQVFGRPDAGNNADKNMEGSARLPASFADGTTNTILFAEKYAVCALLPDYPNYFGGSLWALGNTEFTLMAMFAYGSKDGTRGYGNAYDTSNGQLSVVGPASKFQTRPYPLGTICNAYLSQTPHSGGMNVCLADGSVRILSSSMSPLTWWAVVTPAGGEALGPEW